MKKTAKQIVEEKFHDDYASGQDLGDLNVWENFSLAAQENRYARGVFGKLRGKRILDLGCGFGETAIYWAKKGAKVEAVDISLNSIKLARRLALKHSVSDKVCFQQMPAENLKFSGSYFDFVFGNGVLHHVDIDRTVREVYRVLKPSGVAVFVEPLAYNPVINIYRSIADRVRTPTERPIFLSDIKKTKKVFKNLRLRYFQLFTLLIFLWFFLVSRVSPNEERYWRKILKVKGVQKSMLKILILADKIFLKIFPPLRPLCWNIVIELRK